MNEDKKSTITLFLAGAAFVAAGALLLRAHPSCGVTAEPDDSGAADSTAADGLDSGTSG